MLDQEKVALCSLKLRIIDLATLNVMSFDYFKERRARGVENCGCRHTHYYLQHRSRGLTIGPRGCWFVGQSTRGRTPSGGGFIRI